MNCIIWIATIVIALCSFSNAQSIIPPLEVDGFTFNPTGISRGIFSSEEISDGDHMDWANLRLRLGVQTPNPKLGALFEVELVDADKPDAHWLRMAYASYKITEKWVVRGGHLFLGAPYYSTKPFFGIETARFPREPWGYYAYGIQTEGAFDNGWSLIADISGKSGISFSHDDNFDRLETSGRIGKKLTDSFSAGLLYQLSEDFIRAGPNFCYERGKVSIYGELYATHDDVADTYGGYIFGNYRITKNILPHLQFDFKHIGTGDISLIITPGILFRTENDNLRLIVDYEWHVQESDKNGLYGSLQFRF